MRWLIYVYVGFTLLFGAILAYRLMTGESWWPPALMLGLNVLALARGYSKKVEQ